MVAVLSVSLATANPSSLAFRELQISASCVATMPRRHEPPKQRVELPTLRVTTTIEHPHSMR